MATIPKKWLQRKIADLESCREDIPFGLDENDHNMLIALKIALTSLEAKPVAWTDDDWTVVTDDGSLSAHYENTILITKGEPEILSL